MHLGKTALKDGGRGEFILEMSFIPWKLDDDGGCWAGRFARRISRKMV